MSVPSPGAEEYPLKISIPFVLTKTILEKKSSKNPRFWETFCESYTTYMMSLSPDY